MFLDGWQGHGLVKELLVDAFNLLMEIVNVSSYTL